MYIEYGIEELGRSFSTIYISIYGEDYRLIGNNTLFHHAVATLGFGIVCSS